MLSGGAGGGVTRQRSFGAGSIRTPLQNPDCEDRTGIGSVPEKLIDDCILRDHALPQRTRT